MLAGSILRLYHKFRLLSYRRLFGAIREKRGSLSAIEAFSADVINLLEEPTVTQFANYLGISQPNATYKVNSLVAKGYVEKVVPDADRREVRLRKSEKFDGYFHENKEQMERAIDALKRQYSQEELDTTARVLDSLLLQVGDEKE